MAATARNRLFSSSSEDEEGSGTEPHQQKTPASRRPAGTSGKFSTKKPDSLSPELIELNGIYDKYNYRLAVYLFYSKVGAGPDTVVTSWSR